MSIALTQEFQRNERIEGVVIPVLLAGVLLLAAPSVSAGPTSDFCRRQYTAFFERFKARSTAQTEKKPGLFTRYRVLADDEVLLTSGTPRRESLPSQGMKVVIWNAYKGQKAEFPAEFRDLTRSSDLALIQEAFADVATRKPFPDSQGLQWRMAAAFADQEESLAGVATGSSAPPKETWFIRSRPTEPISHTPKMALVSKHPIEGSSAELLSINVHAINFVSTDAFKRHLAQIEEAVRAHAGPMILAGDFNTWSPGRLEALRALARKYGLRSVKPSGDDRMLPLDHVFVRELDVRAARMVNDSQGSDHKPIELVLDFSRN